LLNALPGTGIHVADQFTVSRGKLIELVDPILDGLNMPPYICFARKRMKDERSEARLIAFPEVLAGGL
jgi:hypothetical protein